MASVYVIVSILSYPFGGGEDFLKQTMDWSNNLGFKSYWISFQHVKNGIYNKLEVVQTEMGTMIHIPGGFNHANLYNWLKLLRPTFIHTQGRNKKEILDVSENLRIPTLNGYHFWNGLIDLYPLSYNKDIIGNLSKHKKCRELDLISRNKFNIPYVCSKFMQEVTKDICNIDLPIIYASSSRKDTLVPKVMNYVQLTESIRVKGKKFVTQINIHKLKGGEIFYELVKSIKLPYIAIQSEPGSEDLDLKISSVISTRKNSLFFNHLENMRDIYTTTKILIVPSLVDETFCRVINEGLMNGIPIVTTGAGNIKYLVGDAAIILSPEDPSLWKQTIRDLYYDKELLNKYSQKSLFQYSLFSEKIASSQFNTLIKSCLDSNINKERNLMILVPFVDQGLGVQGRNYVDLLEKHFNVFIFSYLPYNATSAKDLQINPQEWNSEKYNVFYSNNTRENITDIEIIEFVNNYNIGKCIIPETCWKRIFEIGKLLKSIGVQSYAIPNIEIVRKDEIFKHRVFEKILCNNSLCENKFKSHGFKNLINIGYSVVSKKICNNPSKETVFLSVGGMNSISRKQIDKVCESFVKAYNESNNKNIKLIVTIQKFYDPILDQYKKYPFIEVIDKYLSYTEIGDLYEKSDVVIQVSKKEGLGLGFFDALCRGIPVLTLDTEPHNEIVIKGINGWTCLCGHQKMVDNPESLIEDAIVDINRLTEMIKYVSNLDDEVLTNMKYSTIEDYKDRFSVDKFTERILNSLM